MESESSLYESLVKEFGKVEKLSNGMYHATKGKVDYWIPSNTTDVSNVVIWYPGMTGASGNCGAPVKNLCNGSNPPDYIVAMSAYDGNNAGTYGNNFTKVTETLDNCNITINKGVGVGFSGSGNTVLKQFNETARDNSELASKFTLFDLEGSFVTKEDCSASNLDAIVENNVPVYFVARDTKPAYLKEATYLCEQGVNCDYLETSQYSHGGTNGDFWSNGIPDYVFGNGSQTTTMSDLSYQRYSYNNGEWTADNSNTVTFAGSGSSIVTGSTYTSGVNTDSSAYGIIGGTGEDGSYSSSTEVSGGGEDINLPEPEAICYVLNKISSLRATLVSALSSKLNSFDTMGLDLNGIEASVSSMKSSFNSMTGSGSTLDQSYNILKKVADVLGIIETNTDLFSDYDYSDYYNSGNYNDLASQNNDYVVDDLTFTNTGSSSGTTDTRTFPEYGVRNFRNKSTRESFVELNADDLNALFDNWADKAEQRAKNKGIEFTSDIRGKGQYFIDAANKYNVDPLLLVGIAGKETGRGSVGAKNYMKNNNFFGMDYLDVDGDGKSNSFKDEVKNGGQTWFDTPEEMIDACVKRISEFYIDEHKGKTTYLFGQTGYGPGASYGDDLASIMKESYDYIKENATKGTTTQI